MTAYVFECPECGHICEQEKIPPAPETENDIIWQCWDCSVIYTERYRRQVAKRRRRRRRLSAFRPEDHITRKGVEVSIEIKCDRCGKPMEPEGSGVYSSRIASTNLVVNKDGHGEMYDLCDDCLQKLDIFMSGKMPAPEHKPGELVYFELPNPSVFSSDDRSSNRLDLHVSTDLDQIERLFDPYDPSPIVKQVILGVKLR